MSERLVTIQPDRPQRIVTIAVYVGDGSVAEVYSQDPAERALLMTYLKGDPGDGEGSVGPQGEQGPQGEPGADGTDFNRFVLLTQADYDALDPVDAGMLYIIVEGPVSGSLLQWEQLTQAEYDAIGTPDPETLYIVIG